MKNLLWRMLYAVVAFVMFWLVFPLFLSVIGFAFPGDLLALMKIITACIAVLYVLFGPTPPTPW